MSKAKSRTKQEEALQLLDDLDSFTPLDKPIDDGPSVPSTASTNNEGEAEVLAFLDEITQKSAEPTRAATSHLERPASRSATPTLRKSTERVRLGGSALGPTPPPSKPSTPTTSREESGTSAQPGGWGWSSVWSTASVAIQQAKSVVDEQVKQLPNNDVARKWGEGVYEYAKSAQLDKLGQDFKRVGLTTLTDILNVVAPPISEHEVIQVWLSHDMIGFEGVESLVYRSLTRIMEQVEGGDLVVNRGEESRPKDSVSEARDLNAVEGYDAAVKLAQANLDELVKKKNATKPSQTSSDSPTSYSYVYLRVQPFFTSYVLPAKASEETSSSSPVETSVQQQLQYLLYLSDPSHNLIHTSVTQTVPGAWLALWDQHEWVEDLVAEVLRVGVEVIGQEYIVARMGSDLSGKQELAEPVETVNEKSEETDS